MYDLYNIKDPSFVKKLSIDELNILAKEIRTFLLEKVSKTGGHLSSNLGIVELTIGLHYVFDSPQDKFIFDVGHQSYVHKILTGRAKDFDNLRKIDGMSGFIKRKESIHDVYEAGHSSTSISAASGFATVSTNNKSRNKAIAIIGDASIANGMAFEALNTIPSSNISNYPIVVLNDNEMSISKNVGSLSSVLSRLRTNKFYIKSKDIVVKRLPKFIFSPIHAVVRGLRTFLQGDNIFEDLGWKYYGLVDGNDIKEVIKSLNNIKNKNSPVLIHMKTKKGKGYKFAEDDKLGSYHGVSPFKLETGLKSSSSSNYISWSQHISNIIVEQATGNENIYTIVPAMKSGSKLEEFSEKFPNRFIDVGIAEEHATTMASSIGLSGKKVFLPMYSTFSQRAYDQISHDIARQNANVLIGIDRAGIVGEDGETHQGIYDIALLKHIPNLSIYMPKDANDANDLLNLLLKSSKPAVIRYPRGSVDISDYKFTYNTTNLKWKKELEGTSINIISYGPNVDRIISICKDNNISANVYNARSIEPIDFDLCKQIISSKSPTLVYEENIKSSSLLSSILEYCFEEKIDVSSLYSMNLDNIFLEHGSREELLKRYKLCDESILNKIKSII